MFFWSIYGATQCHIAPKPQNRHIQISIEIKAHTAIMQHIQNIKRRSTLAHKIITNKSAYYAYIVKKHLGLLQCKAYFEQIPSDDNTCK